MSAIVTDVEGAFARPEQHSRPRFTQRRRVRRPALALLAAGSVSILPVLAIPTAGHAATVGSLQAQASSLQRQIQSEGMTISALGQKYDQATNQLNQIKQQIATTESHIASDRQHVALDKLHLRKAAINSYVTDGAASGPNPLFSANQKTYAAAQEYGEVAAGNLNVAVANLHTDEVALGAETAKLTIEQGSAQSAVNAAASAREAADAQQSALESSLSQVQGQLGALERAAQGRSNASESAVTRSRLASSANFPPPPTNSAGGRAVAAAETQLGVPYVWGGESPGRGFDCSGLVAWAWGQAGHPLPHFSGAQMSDSAPVPVSDLEPGDLLFYGPGGDDHVAMYVGGGEMIEAPYTGAYVWITPLRLGDGFVGAGRP